MALPVNIVAQSNHCWQNSTKFAYWILQIIWHNIYKETMDMHSVIQIFQFMLKKWF